MEVGSIVSNLHRKSSIENEPLTLHIDQIQIAREAALYVLSTSSMEEALRIFSQGLKPVLNCARDNGEEEDIFDEDEDEDEDEFEDGLIQDIVSAPL